MNNPGDDHRHSFAFWQVLKKQIGFITIAFLTITTATLAVTYFETRSYLAKVALEVKPDNPQFNDSFSGPNLGGYNEAFVGTQTEIMRTGAVLKSVVDDLGLVKAYSGSGPSLSAQDALDLLRRQLVIEERKGANMVFIGALNKDPKLAAAIANAVAASYVEVRSKMLRDTIDWNLQEAADQVEKQRRTVIELHQTAIHLLADLELVDNDPMNPTAPVAASKSDDASKARLREYLDAKTRYLDEKHTLDSLNMSLETERMREGVEPIPARVWEKASAPTLYIWPNAKAWVALALAIGSIVSLALAFLLEYLRTRPSDSLPPAGGLTVAAI